MHSKDFSLTYHYQWVILLSKAEPYKNCIEQTEIHIRNRVALKQLSKNNNNKNLRKISSWEQSKISVQRIYRDYTESRCNAKNFDVTGQTALCFLNIYTVLQNDYHLVIRASGKHLNASSLPSTSKCCRNGNWWEVSIYSLSKWALIASGCENPWTLRIYSMELHSPSAVHLAKTLKWLWI